MRLPAGLEATGETMSLDELLDYWTSASGGSWPEPTPVKAGAWHT